MNLGQNYFFMANGRFGSIRETCLNIVIICVASFVVTNHAETAHFTFKGNVSVYMNFSLAETKFRKSNIFLCTS